MRLRGLVLAASFLVGIGLAAAEPALPCQGVQKPWVVAELLFGRTGVSEARWARFLAAEVTSRFPDGLTVLDARGQWRAPGGTKIIRERSKVLMIAMPPHADNDAKINAIAETYKKQFRQASVGIIVRPACVAF